MPKRKQPHVAGGNYFISAVGFHREPIFADEQDRLALDALVGQVIAACDARAHAYCWLEQQILLVLQVSSVSPAVIMRRITSPHARRVNHKLGYKGRLFEHPYQAALLPDRPSLLKAVAMVALSPLQARNVPDAAQFPWSSHRAYLGLQEVPWLTKRVILGLLGITPSEQSRGYAALIQQEENWVRSHADDSLINAFFTWLKSHTDELARPATLDQLIDAVACWFRVNPSAIESSETSIRLSLARALITWTAMQNKIASLSDLAKRFGRGRSTLHEIREAYRLRAPGLFSIPVKDILDGPSGLPDPQSVLEKLRR